MDAEKLIAAIANLGYPVGMGLGPSTKDAERILRTGPITLEEFKVAILDLIAKANESGLDTVDIYDALKNETEAYGYSFTVPQ